MGFQWNFGDLLDVTAQQVPADRPAIICGDKRILWPDFDARTNRLARHMVNSGLEPRDRIAILARNVPEYIEIAIASFKARVSSVNVNYRYTSAEIEYVLMDSGARELFYQPEFEPVVAPLRKSLPNVRFTLVDPDGTYGEITGSGDAAPLDIVRSGEDGYLIYTGGTTGKPKGVVWRAADARAVQLESPSIKETPQSMEDHAKMVRENTTPHRVLPACPLMHGAGMNTSLAELVAGGTVVLLPAGPFSAQVLLDEVERCKVTRILIVGDVFARPIWEALDAEPTRWDTTSLKIMSSAGLMWSREVKSGLIKHIPQISLIDILGASEASGFGYALTTAERETPTGWFEPGPFTVIIDVDTGKIAPAGVPAVGLIGRDGPVGFGYHGDPEKTAETYRMIDGKRYAVPGDIAARETDNRLRLIGRGSQVINSGGEKIFTEEVEEALKRADGVLDAIVVGVPNEKWGRVVIALARVSDLYDEKSARVAMLGDLAPYKIPKQIFCVPEIPRHPSGKSDYKSALTMALARLA